jgi:hypothetical protein
VTTPSVPKTMPLELLFGPCWVMKGESFISTRLGLISICPMLGERSRMNVVRENNCELFYEFAQSGLTPCFSLAPSCRCIPSGYVMQIHASEPSLYNATVNGT